MAKETQLQVEAIKNGTVIDTSLQTSALKCLNYLQWTNRSSASPLA